MRAAIVFFILLSGKCAEYNIDNWVWYQNDLNLLTNPLPNCGNNTGNDLSDDQRIYIVNTINRFRSTDNSFGLRDKRATDSNYRKRYSCIFEAEAKFKCNADLNPEQFKKASYEVTWRQVKQLSEHQIIPDLFNQSITAATKDGEMLRMILSPDVTEIGCFDKICDGYEYIACKTDQSIVLLEDEPLKTPRNRCKMDSDCTLPGYTRCDAALGLCDVDPKDGSEVSPLVCLDFESPLTPLFQEKCDNVSDTGSDISQAERKSIVDIVDKFRAMVNNNCSLGYGVVKPASNYRRVKYNCALEKEAKFECSSNLTPETFTSDKQTWRSSVLTYNPEWRNAIFQRSTPLADQLLLDPVTQTVKNNDTNAVFIRLFMSEDVTELGCFVKLCDEFEYIACRTNHNYSKTDDAPIYTPGQRCNDDEDCMLPGYHVCDANLGLCDYQSHTARRIETSKCVDVQNVLIKRKAEKCNPGEYDTGNAISNKEREVIVHTINHYRKLVNNNCDFGRGIVKPISNYRKIKYSCDLEEQAKFVCKDKKFKFKSDSSTLRFVALAVNDSRTPAFQYWAPFKNDMRIDPKSQTTLATDFNQKFVRLMLSPEVIEIGCFVQVCGIYEYVACKTGHAVAGQNDKPLYTPGSRCTADFNCTIPGFRRCDTVLGLCDYDPKDEPQVSPLVCMSVESPVIPLYKEKCDNGNDTGSEISQAGRNKILDIINELRSSINNECNFGQGVLKPASNYRKVKYSCVLERKSRFECPVGFPHPMSDDLTWRFKLDTLGTRLAFFGRDVPPIDTLDIFPQNQTINTKNYDYEIFMKLFLSEDVTEVGCFVRVCTGDVLIACKSNHDRTIPKNAPVYTPGQRCNIDADCTLPGYPFCDASMGLCDFKSHAARQMEALSSRCDDVRHIYIHRTAEKCIPWGFDTGGAISNKEREIIVHLVNHYRQLINNECDLGKGPVKPISNYRKVKYSCPLEDHAKFECSNVTHSDFKSDNYTLRNKAKILNESSSYRQIFVKWAPYNNEMQIDHHDQTIAASERMQHFLRLVLSPNVNEIGCYIKDCDGYDYLACKTGQVVVAPKNMPLYTPGNRCTVDSDCTIPLYKQCDVISGLCELDPEGQKLTVPRFSCFPLSNPILPLKKEKCDNIYDTGSDISQTERDKIVDLINEYRGLINNNCALGRGIVKQASNYRKVKYSCDIEIESQFECKPNLTNNFTSDATTWRKHRDHVYSSHSRHPIFYRRAPKPGELKIYPDTQTVGTADDIAVFIRLFLSEDVTEVGCYVKYCNQYSGNEYIACRTNRDPSLPVDSPIYTPGKRCNADTDCTLPGYPYCDAFIGLCDYNRSELIN